MEKLFICRGITPTKSRTPTTIEFAIHESAIVAIVEVPVLTYREFAEWSVEKKEVFVEIVAIVEV